MQSFTITLRKVIKESRWQVYQHLKGSSNTSNPWKLNHVNHISVYWKFHNKEAKDNTLDLIFLSSTNSICSLMPRKLINIITYLFSFCSPCDEANLDNNEESPDLTWLVVLHVTKRPAGTGCMRRHFGKITCPSGNLPTSKMTSS
jgi:hypothetical protein